MLKRWHVLFMLLCFDKVLQSHTESETSSGITIRSRDTPSSCSKGWFEFGEMCYKLGGKNKIRRLPWDQASEACREDYKGKLASVHSEELNEFLVAFFLVSVKENLWIGLHDRVNESVYTWEDGTILTHTSYENWEPNQPRVSDVEREDCVEMIHHTLEGITGQWNDIDCGVHYQFICQKEKGKYSQDYLDPRKCPSDVGGGWKKATSCFNIIEEEMTWSDAEDYCIQNFRGHLVTITDFPVNIFINYILQDQGKNMWIGIRTKNQFQQQWSSGWYVSFENWAEGEKPEEFDKGSCVARDHEGKWVTHSCDKVFPFICEYSTDKPPILKPKTEGTSCPDVPADWRDLGGDFCYYFEVNYAVNWYEANFLCMRRGGTLLTIHSQEEARILQNFIMFMTSSVYYKWHALFIGLYRHIQHDEEFVWVDGSSLVDAIKNWDDNEPNTEKEKCVEMKSYDLKWNDIDCKQVRGYICSAPKVSSNHTNGHCANETIVHSPPYSNGHSTSVLAGVIVCVIFVSVLIGVIVFYFCFSEKRYEHIKKISGLKLQSPVGKPRYRSEIVLSEEMYSDVI